jgi:hypothetical protein
MRVYRSIDDEEEEEHHEREHNLVATRQQLVSDKRRMNPPQPLHIIAVSHKRHIRDQREISKKDGDEEGDDALLYELLEVVPADSNLWGGLCAKFSNVSNPTECAIAIARTLDSDSLRRYRAPLMRWARDEENNLQERRKSDRSASSSFSLFVDRSAPIYHRNDVASRPAAAHFGMDSQRHQLLVQRKRQHIHGVHNRPELPPGVVTNTQLEADRMHSSQRIESTINNQAVPRISDFPNYQPDHSRQGKSSRSSSSSRRYFENDVRTIRDRHMETDPKLSNINDQAALETAAWTKRSHSYGEEWKNTYRDHQLNRSQQVGSSSSSSSNSIRCLQAPPYCEQEEEEHTCASKGRTDDRNVTQPTNGQDHVDRVGQQHGNKQGKMKNNSSSNNNSRGVLLDNLDILASAAVGLEDTSGLNSCRRLSPSLRSQHPNNDEFPRHREGPSDALDPHSEVGVRIAMAPETNIHICNKSDEVETEVVPEEEQEEQEIQDQNHPKEAGQLTEIEDDDTSNAKEKQSQGKGFCFEHGGGTKYEHESVFERQA